MEFKDLAVFIAQDNKCGKNEEYNPLYVGMDSLLSPQTRDFKELSLTCSKLWQTTRDLRVAVYWAFANLQTGGLSEFAKSLRVVDWLISELWQEFYPLLDNLDDNDPVERLNILQTISPNPIGDIGSFLQAFRSVKLFDSLDYTLRDLLIATGELQVQDQDLDIALFFNETNVVAHDEVSAKITLIDEIINTLSNIENNIYEKTEQKYSFSFEILRQELGVLRKFYSGLDVKKIGDGSNLTGEPSQENQIVRQNNYNNVDLNLFTVKNRQEALILLDKIAQYFRQSEPTSPVPFLLERAIRVSQMNFIDLLVDMEPSSVDRFKDILGIPRQ